ncbi:MAG: hypothetical protein KGQ36_07605 [Rickettsiales bacterium]|nr:hypothetical protein [Rickettsiales bacterium]
MSKSNSQNIPSASTHGRDDLGCIIVLRGATSAGKTTICNNVLKRNEELGQAHEIVVDGIDAAAERGLRRNIIATIVDDAVERSKNGISTILDIGFVGGDLSKFFEESFKKHEVQPSVDKALIYVPLSTIIERINTRNEMAMKESGDISNSRLNPSASICGMSLVFTTNNEKHTSSHMVVEISHEEITESLERLGLNPESKADTLKILCDGIGIDRASTKSTPQAMFVNSKSFDRIFYPHSLEASEKIAEEILEIIQKNKRSQATISSLRGGIGEEKSL